MVTLEDQPPFFFNAEHIMCPTSAWDSFPGCIPSQLLSPPAYLLEGSGVVVQGAQREMGTALMLCRTAQQEPSHWCAPNTVQSQTKIENQKLLSETITMNSPEISAHLKWRFSILTSKLLQLKIFPSNLQHPSSLVPASTKSQRSCLSEAAPPQWQGRADRPHPELFPMKVCHHLPPSPPF